MAVRTRPVTWGDLRQAVVWQGLRDALAALTPRDDSTLGIVDAGGGSGGFAVPLAEQGHRVTVIDPSPDALASLDRRAAERGVTHLVDARQGDLSTVPEIVGVASSDVLLCHTVLEVVDEPDRALAVATVALRPGGLLSVVAANRNAVVLARALAGRFAEARYALADPGGRCATSDPAHRFDAETLTRMVADAGADVIAIHGVRVFADLVPGALVDADPSAAERLLRLEIAASSRHPFRDLATQLHVLARRREQPNDR
ncbi:methyltransferase domain-containing protein [Frankia sp. Cppng1_Ct_nod]|uniref:methyltransferase domain-containing protein n=1 Tax=Frankia sp. Cppng1_Ct_nod TaxID=2897162 RepID=UPI0010412B73|nr:methyltransferase domain-containing protein [Frankia sp. Cppng1_Ct_nod]